MKVKKAPQVVLYIAASLDGYIAGKKGEIGWLDMVDEKGQDYGYYDFYNSVDALIMGSTTYKQVLEFGEWHYAGKATFVLSDQNFNTSRNDLFFLKGTADEVYKEISAKGYKKIWLVGGGKIVNSFLQQNLIDEIIISIIPILLGEGILLFPGNFNQNKLKLIECESYKSGLVQMRYSILK